MKQELKTVANAFIISRLEYCNFLYAVLSQSLMARLQLVQNAVARFLYGAPPPYLASLLTRYIPERLLRSGQSDLVPVAVIIPFRNRHENLTHWLYYLHPFLQRQQLDYGVYVINQDGDGTFNRAKLMNIGYAEALKEDDYNCFLFSDVDLVPLDDRNLYRCFSNPRHLSVAVDKFDYKLPYEQIFGGVTALTKEQFLTINGLSNTFWGWGGEDDDLYNRVMLRIKAISRPYAVIGRYKMIKHERDPHNDPNFNNVKKLQETTNTLDQDGLSSLNYTVIDITKNMLFTFITVDVHVPMGLTKK
nr:beta-1,4-galactosyltransferase 1-like [Nothobranchius furzeri]